MSSHNDARHAVHCLRHAYFGALVPATLGATSSGVGAATYCEECHEYLFPERRPAKGDAGHEAPPQITHYDKEAT